jgi:hypothetical protein
MGEMYRATCAKLGRDVAPKVSSVEMARDSCAIMYIGEVVAGADD